MQRAEVISKYQLGQQKATFGSVPYCPTHPLLFNGITPKIPTREALGVGTGVPS